MRTTGITRRRSTPIINNVVTSSSEKIPNKYKMTISRMTVDKLGVKLYDRVYAVIAELISNSYDADATTVTVRAPMGQYLAHRIVGKVTSKPVVIEVEDNGIGMCPEELQDFYLVVGKERRIDGKRGDVSKLFKRKVMGRKGVGKLAPFGVCRYVEIISAGGEKINEDGVEGYRIAHIILDKDGILTDTDADYEPEVGELDGKLRAHFGTKVILRVFDYRRIGTIDELARQLSQRFGLPSKNWRIDLEDSTKTTRDPDHKRAVGEFSVPVMENSKLTFEGTRPTESTENYDGYRVLNPDNTVNCSFNAGFTCYGRFYPITGWAAYAKDPYKDELMAGVRIYCRGKFAAQTTLFNRGSGFTGEHSVRSYLVGELHADWLDEHEDLIQTDRRDILWSHELGSAFQEWGQSIVLHIGKITRDPMRKAMVQKFLEVGNVEEKIREAFPGEKQKELRTSAREVAKLLGKSLRGDELTDQDAIDDMVQLSLFLAPLRTLDDMLRVAADENATPLRMVNEILRTARLAETVTFGRQVEKRLEIIHHLETLKDVQGTPEDDLQNLIESAPWLVNPQWVPVTANQALNTFKKEFAKYYKERTGEEIYLSDFSKPSKRPDFVLFSQDGKLQIIEIKKPKHKLTNIEMDRIVVYFEQFEAFLSEPQHQNFKELASDFHLTLVCDGEELSGAQRTSYKAYISQNKMTSINWSNFLLRTTKTHQEFLDQAEILKRQD